MNQQSTLSPPKSPYQVFIQENDRILNSISRRSKNQTFDFDDQKPSKQSIAQNDHEEDYYESIKESLEMSNININKLQDANNSVISRKNSTPFTPIKEIKKAYTESVILPPRHNLIVSPLDNQKQKKENRIDNSNNKPQADSLEIVETKENNTQSEPISETSNNKDDKLEEESQEEISESGISKQSELSKSAKELFQPEETSQNEKIEPKPSSSSIKMKSSKASSTTKRNQTTSISTNTSARSTLKSSSIASPSKKSPAVSPSKKSRQSVSSHSESPSKTWSLEKSQLATSYVDYLDQKRKRIFQKWEEEDNRAQQEAEESKLEFMLIQKSNWRQFKFSTNRERTQSNFDDGEEMDQNDQPFEFAPPPNPSEHYKKMSEIPVVERLLTPKKNVDIQQKQQSNSPSKRQPYSAKVKKAIPVDEDEFIIRQAQYDNNRRHKLEMLVENSQIKPNKKRADDQVFNQLYEKSLHPKELEPSPKKKDSSLETKWNPDSHLIRPKKVPKPPERINPKDYRDQCFSQQSRILTQNDKRSFQERNSTTFDDVLKKYQKGKEEAKKREQYNEHLDSLEIKD